MPERDLDSVLIALQKATPAVRDNDVSIEYFGAVHDFFNLIRWIFYFRTLQVGLDRASSEYRQLKPWNQFVRKALMEREFLITQDLVEDWSLQIDGFGNIESMMCSDFMAPFWAREEFRLCDAVLEVSEGSLQCVINTRFNIPEESLHDARVFISSARPALIRVLANVQGKQDIPPHFRLSTGLVDCSLGSLPTGGSQAMYHLIAVIPQREDAQWDRLTRFDPGVELSLPNVSANLSILIFALFDELSVSYLKQRKKSSVSKQKQEGSSDIRGQSSGWPLPVPGVPELKGSSGSFVQRSNPFFAPPVPKQNEPSGLFGQREPSLFTPGIPEQ
ncbi:unnamed protein product, partial [Clonostachys rosea]